MNINFYIQLFSSYYTFTSNGLYGPFKAHIEKENQNVPNARMVCFYVFAQCTPLLLAHKSTCESS